MKVLVTGGAGYIGSHVVYELIRDGHEVVVLDDLSTGNKDAVHKGAKLYIGDQKDFDLLNKIFKEHKINVVMHFSAKLIVPESVERPLYYYKNNATGLNILLEAMNENKIKNIIFSSTAAVYGAPEKMPIKESDPTIPINPYGESKLSCEWMIKSNSRATGMNYVIFRYFNVAGADRTRNIGQSTKGKPTTHLIPVIMETVTGERKGMTIFGDDYNTPDGTNVRDYIHVSDLARAHVLGVKFTTSGNSDTFNLGSKNGFTVLSIIDEVKKMGLTPKYKIGKRRNGDPDILVANTDKVSELLSFTPRYSLAEIVKSDYEWRKEKKF